ncbi:MAG: phosphopyruvate hydratase [Thermoplasmata archaeon]|nr:MAG: phosphopyruvate hydratase [Thermoplasmata archaeon]
MTEIEEVVIRKILDSRGNPTVEVDIFTPSGFGNASAPSGASTGSNEVKAFPKEGVDYAIKNFKENVAPRLLKRDVTEQENMDALLHELDGTEDFSSIGGNVTVATSLAVAKAGAFILGLPLYRYIGGAFATKIPFPLGNVLGGGKHAVGGTDIQEFSAIALSSSARQSVFANAQVHAAVKTRLKKKFPDRAIGKGDEGAWVAKMDNEEALELVADACKEVSDASDFDVKPCLDIAASELFQDGNYSYKNGKLSPTEQIEFVIHLIDNYDLYLVEDPLDQEDFEGYSELTRSTKNSCIIVGDDLFVTDFKRVDKGIKMGAANAVLIKPNQIGTLTDAIKTIKLAHDNGYKTVVSHRSGETTDNSIAHLAVAFGSHAIKTGVVGGERTAKLNELIRIEDEFNIPEG